VSRVVGGDGACGAATPACVTQPLRLSDEVTRSLLGLATRCAERGWVPATSGNFSARIDAGSFAITASGLDKGALKPSDLLAIDLEGRTLGPGRPSAETALHAQIYRRRPSACAVAHTHSMAATVASRARAPEGGLVFSGFEMQKALAGITTHLSTVRLPIFPNDQDVPRLAAVVDTAIGGDESFHGYLIEGHGMYTWGRDVTEASRHIEALEFLLLCTLHARP
jgi:methylthioribulose-1-phosphate dehydratase